jgi:hypothetical protein
MLVSRFRFFGCLSGLLLSADMVVTTVLLCRSPVRFRSLFVMVGSLLVKILRHGISFLQGSSESMSEALDRSKAQLRTTSIVAVVVPLYRTSTHCSRGSTGVMSSLTCAAS